MSEIDAEKHRFGESTLGALPVFFHIFNSQKKTLPLFQKVVYNKKNEFNLSVQTIFPKIDSKNKRGIFYERKV